MSPSVLGSSVGAVIGLLLCVYALRSGRRRFAKDVSGSITYPPADWRGAIKGTFIQLAVLVFLHWLPTMLSWTYALVLEKPFAIDEQRFGLVLFVAHVLTVAAISTDLLGNLWATWHASRRAKMN